MNVFKQLIVSLYSPKDIAATRHQGIGKTILFVFLLSLISIIPSAIYFSNMVTTGVEAAEDMLSSGMPDFEIKNGTLTVESNEPYIQQKDDFTIFLDGTGEMTSTDVELRTQNGFALLKNELVFVADGQSQVSPYSVMEGLAVNKQDFQGLVDSVDASLVIAIPLVVLMIYLFSSAVLFIKVTLFAVFGLLFKNSLQRTLGYRHLWRICAYSITLPTIFFTIMSAFQATVPFGSFISWFVTFLMMYMAIKEVPPEKEIIS